MKQGALIMVGMIALAGTAMPAPAADMAGSEVFAHYCSYCHGTEEGPGTQQLRRIRGADRALLARRTDLASDYIEYVVRHGLKSMPPFVPSDLTDTKLRALAGFLTSPMSRK